MNWPAVIVSVVIGLAINEYADIAPWAAHKMVRRAAQRIYTGDAERAEIRAEEWAAMINDRPGKLFKLGTALGYCLAAQLATARRSRYAGAIGRLAIRHLIVFPVLGPETLTAILARRIGRRSAHLVTLATLFAPAVAAVCFAVSTGWPDDAYTPAKLVVALALLPVIIVLATLSNRLYVSSAIAVALIVLVRGGRDERRKALRQARVESIQRLLSRASERLHSATRQARLTVRPPDQPERQGPGL